MAVPGNERVRLDSWKEIAEYLGRDVRTVVRWEKEKGLPVHTVPGLRRRSVFAYADELNQWLEGARPMNGESDEAHAQAGGFSADDSLHHEANEPLENWKSSAPSWPRSRLQFSLAALAIVILVFFVYIVSTGRINTSVSSPVDKVTLRDSNIVAWNKNGKVNWQYKLDPASSGYQIASLATPTGENAVEDTLVALYKKLDNPQTYLLFSSAGRLLWKYSPQDALQFGKETYSEPWAIRALHHITMDGREAVALGITHHTWWPSMVVLVDERGRPVRKFVNSGWVTSLNSFEGSKGLLLVAGGASNAHNAAMIAVLDPARFAGSSPEEKGTPYECKNCEPGGPLAYFIFPRSELNIATGSTFNYSYAYFQGDRLIVQTKEEEAPPTAPRATAIYEFAPDMKLLRASFSDRYWDLHHKLEAEGRIMHAKAECPDRRGPRTVLAWDPRDGWQELHPN